MPFLPFIPFADCIDVAMQFIQQAVPWYLTFGVQSSTSVTPTVLANLNLVFDDWWINHLRPQVNTGAVLTTMKYTDLTTQFGPTLTTVPSATPAGSLAGAVLPAQAAMVVSETTANRGRSFRGRSYLAGRVDADMQTTTNWTATRQAGVQTAYDALLLNLITAGFNLAVLSRQENGVRRTTGVATPVLSVTAKAQIATQRRRLL